MLNIVIIGAGGVGRHLASMLAKEEYNVVLVDRDQTKLEEASWNLDVATRHGSGTDWQLLDDLLELNPNVLVAATNEDETNLVSCSIAKHLGYPRTIARVRDDRYLNRSRLDFEHIFDVNYFVGPELLVANDILKYMISPGALAVEHFAHGAVQLRTLSVPTRWRKSNVPLRELGLPEGLIVALIAREKEDKRSGGGGMREVIFPHGNDVIKPGDEVSFIGESKAISGVSQFLGIKPTRIRSVVIAGGSLIAIHLARLLIARDIDVKIIEKNYDKCVKLNEKVPGATIIHQDATDYNFLRSEKVGDADMFVGCTESDEVNFLSSLLGKEAGCRDALAVLSNMSYAPLAARLGINHAVSPRITASNHILSQIFSGKITSLVSLYDNKAEIMEINVSIDSRLVGIPLSELGPLLPRDFLIAMIQNRGRIMVAHGDRIISPGDTVIVITSPHHVTDLEKMF